LFYLIYHIGFNLYWHRIAYFVVMVPLRIYSLTHSQPHQQTMQPARPRAQRTSPWKSPSGCPW